MSQIVGIDLGTTYTVVAYINASTNSPQIIKNAYGSNTTPSVIGFKSDGSYVIGQDAKDMEESGDVNTASFYKLHMGDSSYKYTFYGRSYTAKYLSTLFLKRLITDSEKSIGDKIAKAVITVPAYFEDAAKNDTIAAGEGAGLKILNIINEPTAACVAYGLNEDGIDRKILIYDLGGGTFDVTIANVKKDCIDVVGTIGHHQLGGRDWDSALAQWLCDKFEEETGADINDDSEMNAILMVKAENAKRQLSSSKFVEILISDGKHKCKVKLSRSDFEDLTSYQLNITTDLIDELLADVKLTWNDIDGAVLVGGSTRMPMVRDYITAKGIEILKGVHPDEAVAIGAAIQANISRICAIPSTASAEKSSLALAPSDLNLLLLPGAKVINDVIPHSLGMIVENADGTRYINDIMIAKNTACSKAMETKQRTLRVSRRKEKNHLDVYLLQGESEEPSMCTVAKKYCFYDIDYVDGGRTLLNITFKHTINGTIDISAVQTESRKALSFREEAIPDDMSWIEQSPAEVAKNNAEPLSGALVMALDLSGSMCERTYGVQAIDNAKKAMINFMEQFEDYDIDVGIIGFSDKTQIMCKPSKNKRHAYKAIQQLESGITGYGNEADPLRTIYNMLIPYLGKPFVYGIVLTDGAWDNGACASALKMKNKFADNEIELIGMGFGGADKDFLKKISTRDDLADVGDITALNENLSSIARVILN